MIYGPYTKEIAWFLHSVYIDPSIIKNRNPESIKKHIDFYALYL
jgi:hypothetical protein